MVTATAEMVPVRVPTEDEFEDDFLDDEVLEAVFVDVVRQYPRLHVITDNGINVRVLWKKKGGKSTGKLAFAKTEKQSGLKKHFGQCDVVIWLAADHLGDAAYTTAQIRKLLYHEARHVGWADPDPDKEDDVGKVVMLGHDLEIFEGELSDTGEWEAFRRRVGNEFRQPNLFSEQDGGR